jgi:hypothetical protein
VVGVVVEAVVAAMLMVADVVVVVVVEAVVAAMLMVADVVVGVVVEAVVAAMLMVADVVVGVVVEAVVAAMLMVADVVVVVEAVVAAMLMVADVVVVVMAEHIRWIHNPFLFLQPLNHTVRNAHYIVACELAGGVICVSLQFLDAHCALRVQSFGIIREFHSSSRILISSVHVCLRAITYFYFTTLFSNKQLRPLLFLLCSNWKLHVTPISVTR